MTNHAGFTSLVIGLCLLTSLCVPQSLAGEAPESALLAQPVYVNKFGPIVRNGESCSTGFATIQEGINEAVKRHSTLVIVCGSAVYPESVTMKDGVSLISEACTTLGETFTAEDVLARCERAAGGQKFPTITNGGAGPVVIFNSLERPIFIRGLAIEGGNANKGGGIFCLKSQNVAIIANCIHSNHASVLGGGVGIEDCQQVLLDRNSIVSNTSDQNGGGVGEVSSHTLHSKDNLIEFNTAVKSGGGMACMNVLAPQEEERTSGTVVILRDRHFQNTATETSGGGVNCIGQNKVKLTKCQFTKCKSDFGGGGGVNIDGVDIAELFDCEFVRCVASAALLPGPDTDTSRGYRGIPSGGGLRVVGSHVDVNRGTFDGCEAALDGGGVLVIGEPKMLSLSEISKGSEVTISGVTIKDCKAADDGGGVSCTLGSDVTLDKGTILKFNTARTGNGGGLHVTCNARAWVKEATEFRRNSCKVDGGGIFIRNSELRMHGEETKESVFVTANKAERHGGGMALITVNEGIEFCDKGKTRADMSEILFDNNEAADKAGALWIARFKDVRTIRFEITNVDFDSNKAKNLQEGAVEIALSNQPPLAPKQSFFKSCTFKNRGIQLKGRNSLGFVDDFYSVINCDFNLTLFDPSDPSDIPIGMDLFNDSPTIRGQKTVFHGVATRSGIGIKMKASKPLIRQNVMFIHTLEGLNATESTPFVSDAIFEENGIGANYVLVQPDPNQPKPVSFIERSSFLKNDKAIRLTSSSPTLEKNTFNSSGVNIDKDANSHPIIK